MGFNSTLPLERFPAPTDGQGMTDFLKHLFEPESASLPAYYVVMYVAAGATCVLVLAASGILALRVWRGMMWILQVYPTSFGSYIIPNSIMSLVILMLCYVIVYVAYALKQIDLFRSFDQRGIFLWRSLPWLPPWSAAWFSAWGTFSSFPDALRISKKGTATRYLLHPTVWNIGVWGAPLLLVTSLAPTIGLSQHHYSHELGRWQEWKAQFANPGADLEALHAFGLDIWLEVTRSYWYYSITMWMWCGWALVCLVSYFSISLHTLLRIRAQVKIADKRQQELQTFYLFPSQAEHPIASESPPEPSSAEKLPEPGSSSTKLRSRPQDGSDTPTSAKDGKQGEGEGQGADGAGLRSPALYPPLRQPAQPKVSKRSHQVSAATRRGEILRHVLCNVVVQYLAINTGAVCYASAAGGIAAGAYKASRSNDLAPHQVNWNYLLAATNISCGVALVVAVLQRSLDPTLTVREDVDGEGSPDQPSGRKKSGAFKSKGWSASSGSAPSRATDTIHINPSSGATGPWTPVIEEAEEDVTSPVEQAHGGSSGAVVGLGVTRSGSLGESVTSRARLVSNTDDSTLVAGGRSSNGDEDASHAAGSKSGRSQILGSIKRARASTSASARAQEEKALAALVQSGSASPPPLFPPPPPPISSDSHSSTPANAAMRQSVRRIPSMSNSAGVPTAPNAQRPSTGTSDVAYATPFGSVLGDTSLSNSPWLEEDLFAPTQPMTPLSREVLDATRREAAQRSRYGSWRDGAPTSPLPPPPAMAQRPRER